MSDFIIQIGKHINPQDIAKKLQNRPGMEDRSVKTYRFEWGSAVLQSPRGYGYESFEKDGVIYACMGRPRFIGIQHESEGPSGFNQQVANRLRPGKENDAFESLTGTHIIFNCSNSRILILTDRMGAFPVYCAKNSNGILVSVGTSVELMSSIAGNKQNWDLVSLSELLVFNNITFPFSTRVGIEELLPAAITKIEFDQLKPRVDSQILWEPEEPSSWHSDEVMIDQTEQALKSAAVEITRGAKSVAVTLSGGLDSRAVLSVIPENVSLSAITYVTHENNETRVAQEVARAAGVEHLFARRGENYFAELLLDLGISLLGSERRAAAHGYCMSMNNLHDKFDAIIGGQLSDTFLKNHYMPFDQREKLRPKGLKEHLQMFANFHKTRRKPNVLSTIGRHLALIHLNRDMQEAVSERRKKRLSKLKTIRPNTGEEWSRFWPTSRQDDLAHVLGNIRLFPFDTLFMQKAIIEVAVNLSPSQRFGGKIANQAFNRIYGHLGNIENANTGLEAHLGEITTKKQRKRHAKNLSLNIPSAAPWNDVQSSWSDNVALQRKHPEWNKVRATLCKSPAINILNKLTEKPAEQLIREYAVNLPPTFNQMLVQLGLYINRSL